MLRTLAPGTHCTNPEQGTSGDQAPNVERSGTEHGRSDARRPQNAIVTRAATNGVLAVVATMGTGFGGPWNDPLRLLIHAM